MRVYVYFLSLILVFAPIYANAFLPVLLAIAGSVGGQIAVGTTKATVKKIAPNAQKNFVKGALGVCAKSRNAEAFCTGLVGALVGNGLDIEVNNTDVTNNDIDVNIYKKDQNNCKSFAEYFTFEGTISIDKIENINKNFYSSYSEVEDLIKKRYNNAYPKADFSKIKVEESPEGQLAEAKQNFQSYKSRVDLNSYGLASGYYKVVRSSTIRVNVGVSYNTYGYHLLIISNCNNKIISDEDYIKIFNEINSDDIVNIYNYDYSKHENITINNETINGDTINNSKNDFDTNYNEKQLSENATDKMKKGDKDYEIDKINDKNCTKNSKGEYDKCGKDKEENKDKEDNKDDVASTPKDTEFPNFCDWASFICDDKNTDTKVDISDNEVEPVDTNINFSGSCPNDVVLNFNLFGNSFAWTVMAWSKYCSILSDYVKPIVIAMASYQAVMILGGRNEPN